jgi:hypothetical protein
MQIFTVAAHVAVDGKAKIDSRDDGKVGAVSVGM